MPLSKMFNDAKIGIKWLIFHSQTTATRFWFGLSSLGFASLLLFSDNVANYGSPYYLMMRLAPEHVWACLFLLHALALWYGAIMHKYNTILLLLEGVLGVALWVGAAAAATVHMGAPNSIAAGSLLSLWLLIRYPTHSGWGEEDCDHAY